ncbi:receptor-type tyrosine-protein phosphatase epsilon-like isoform X1 [Acanthaster planci]|uniref:protein-tyrosine-phosphatase n=1 Tax=Acanthaster planci TaxID=133434 RepID=A0A8B8A0P7_ACAPL|nr:receptor-type tyrosine-protein phosphatase epsilon-like isoform X1 [Acanthaster planci]
MNGGTCSVSGSSFSCTCLSVLTGMTCETYNPCLSSPCMNGGTCSYQGSSHSCACLYPYTGNTCEIFNPCQFSPCMNGGTCSVQRSSFTCTCLFLYTGSTCDIFDPCLSSPCLNGGTCYVEGSAFRCTCSSGLVGNTCTFLDPCLSSPCMNGGTCSAQGTTFNCTCLSNYTGNNCEAFVFQIICEPDEVTAVGTPGMTVSVGIPQPFASSGASGVQFTYIDPQGMVISTPSDYQVAVPLTDSTTLNIQINATGSFNIVQQSCRINVTITGLPYINQTPSVTLESRLATVTWQAWNTSSGDRGAGPVTAYKVYYSLTSPISWIAAGTILVTDPSQSTYNFIVQPLEPSTEYMFSVAAVGEGTGEGARSPAFTGFTLPLPSTTTERSTSRETTVTERPSDPTAVIAATVSVVAVLLVVLLFLAVLLVPRLRRRQSKDVSSHSLQGRFESSNDLFSLQTIDNPISVPMEDMNSNPNGEGVPEMTPAVRPESSVSQISTLDSSSPFAGLPLYPAGERELKKDPIPLKDFVAYVRQAVQGHHLGDEWSSFPGIEAICSCDVSQLPDNKMKNRYRNIPAYDHCRVILEHDQDDPNLGYINACYIKGYKKDKAYIATQGPNQATSHDFWKMVWQENVRIIVNGTKLVEDGKNKCSKYWPDMGKAEIFGGILISLQTEEARGEYTVRTMSIVKIGDNTSGAKTIRQYHYTTWPDKNVPKDVTPVLRLIKEFSDATPEGAGPYLIHCSAGVGRTGAIIAIHALLQQAHAEKTLDIYNFVADMRDHRVSIVQTPVQYTFIHLALLEALFSGDTCIPSSSLKKRVTELKKKKKMAEEFEQMNTITPVPVRERCRMSVVASNRNKNRFPNTIIPETCRPFLMTPREDGMEYNYINATFVDGYKQKDVAVVTQAPLPNTVLDLWRLLYDYQATSIVMLNAMDASDSDCPQYWPDKCSQDYGPFTVSVTSAAELDGYKVKQLILHHRRQKRSRYLKHYQVTDWPVNQETPKSPSTLLRLILTVEKEKKGKHSSILVHCIDGQNRSGVFCVLKNSLDRLRQDDTVDIMQTTKVLRLNRPNMLNSLNLYRFCYDAMLAYVSNPDEFKADRLPEPVYENMPTKQKEEKAKPPENIYQNVAKSPESSEA